MKPLAHGPTRHRQSVAIAVVLLILACAVACSKVPLTAPTQSTITLFASNTTLTLNGSIEITANVTEQSGTPVQNGTLVTFNTTLGTLEPSQAETVNGRATVRLAAGTQSGTAQVSATSGAAKTDKPLEIKVGGAAVGRLDLTANPSTLPAGGGTTELIASTIDGSGNRLPGVPVSFNADAGAMTASLVVSDQNGEARTRLSTTRTTKVTATAGGSTGSSGSTSAPTATVTVQLNVVPAVSISAAGSPAPVEGQPMNFTLAVTPNSNGAAIRDVTVSFGDGDTRSLGVSTGTTTISHTYSRAGTYIVMAVVSDAAGDRTSASTIVSVMAATPLNVTIQPPAQTKVQTAIPFVTTVTPNTAAVVRFDWSFGDGSSATSSGNHTSHVYGSTGQFTVTVTAVAADGRSGVGRIEIFVTP